MEASSSPETLIQRSVTILSQQDSYDVEKELELIEKCLKNETYFSAAVGSSELLDLIVNIFVTSITSMATISNILSSSTRSLSKDYFILRI